MNLEFHYWVVLYLARRAGLGAPSAERIAYSSQLTDDRTYPISVKGRGGTEILPATQPLELEGGRSVLKARMAFHFVPGSAEDAASARKDGRPGRYAVTPNNRNAKSLLVEALHTGNEYRIGIALHAYADTWAHQNFSAAKDASNAFYPDDPVPPIGHAPALKKPDFLNEVWEDPRLIPTMARVDNRVRFAAAARMIYKYLATYARRGFDDVDLVLADLEQIWGLPGLKGRQERFLDYAISLEVPPYDRDAWMSAAGLGGAAGEGDPSLVGKLVRRGGEWLTQKLGAEIRSVGPAFYESDLYLWTRAAADHAAAFDRLGIL